MKHDPAPVAADPVAMNFTDKDIARWLVAGFAEMISRPVYAAQGNAILSVSTTPGGGMAPSATFDIIAFAVTVLGKKNLECLAVLTWARSTAARESSKGDWSIAEFCRTHNWNRQTFDRRRARACVKIALAKNIADGFVVEKKSSVSRRKA